MLKYLKLSFPIILAATAEPFAGIIDTALVGNKGTDELAAMAVGVVLISTFGWVFNFLVHRPTSNISRFAGLEDWDEVAINIKQALIASASIGTAVSVLLYLLNYKLFELTAKNTELIEIGIPYFNYRLIGNPFFMLFLTLAAISRGLGNTTIPLIAIITTTTINVIGSTLSLYYFDFGLIGVGASTSIAFICGALIIFIWLLIETNKKNIPLFSNNRINFNSWSSFGKDSFYIFTRTAFLTVSIYSCTPIAAKMGIEYLAALQIIAEIWLFSSILIDGFGTVGNMKAAEYLGKKDIVSYRELLSSLVKLSLITSSLLALALWLFQNLAIRSFTSDVEVINILVNVFPIVCLALISQSVPDVCDGILYGAKQYKFAAMMMAFGAVFIFTPVLTFAYFQNLFIWIISARAILAIYRGILGFIRLKTISA